MRTRYTVPVLILGSPNGPAKDITDEISNRYPEADFYYASTDREAQRQVRTQPFVAIVAVDRGFMDFCVAMIPMLTQPGSMLDVIVANIRGIEELYGIVLFKSNEQVIEVVDHAIGHQKALDEADNRARVAVPISAPPAPSNP